MIYQRENGACTGRGFANSNANGFLAKFKTWIAQAYPSGPGWTIIDDQSQDPSYAKWGKLSTTWNGVGGSFDTLAEIQAITNGSFRLTIGTTTANVTGINFSSATSWDDVASIIQTAIRAASGAAEFTNAVCGHIQTRGNYSVLYHRFVIVAGSRGLDVGYLTTATASVGTDISGGNYLKMNSGNGTIESATTNPFIVVCNNAAPNWYDDPPNKYIQIGIDGTSGYVYISVYLNWDVPLHTGLHLWQHAHLTTEDDNPFVYDFRGGSEMMIIQSFRASTWYTFVMDKWVGDPILLENITVKGKTIANATTSNNTITLGTGEGSLFTNGNYYFLIDLYRSESVQYLKIASGGISGDSITFTTNLGMDADTSSILSPYYHRYFTCATGSQSAYQSRLPYISYLGREVNLGDYYSDMNGCYGDILGDYLTKMAPSDSSSYACMRPGIVEENAAGAGNFTNRAFGSSKNIYVTSISGMGAATDGRTINGKNYLYFKTHGNLFYNGSGSLAVLFPDYNENV